MVFVLYLGHGIVRRVSVHLSLQKVFGGLLNQRTAESFCATPTVALIQFQQETQRTDVYEWAASLSASCSNQMCIPDFRRIRLRAVRLNLRPAQRMSERT